MARLIDKEVREKIDAIRGAIAGRNDLVNFFDGLLIKIHNQQKVINKQNKEIANACKYYHKIDKEIAVDWRTAEANL
jgi:RNA binding exosome subunit